MNSRINSSFAHDQLVSLFVMALWDKIGSRGNVEDRRGLGAGGVGVGLGGIVLILALNFLGGGTITDALPQVLNQLQNIQPASAPVDAALFEGEDSYEVFTSTVLGSTNDIWTKVFASKSMTFEPPKLVLFRGGTQSACGGASAATGPHYCPNDRTIYLDETFFDELTTRFGAKGGDVAQAYVIAHEAGHHVQTLLGAQQQVQQDGSNNASIKLELQADCYAGVWANSIRNAGVFEEGEIVEAIDAAAAVGDDRIQERVEGRVDPESWTHGSSAERVRWFNVGYDQGTLEACNTFAT